MVRQARLKDIAEELNLSVMTVSRAINNHPDVSPKTLQLVQKTAERLHYRPNELARSLVLRKSRVIGLVVPDISSSFFAEIAKGVQAVAAQRGYCVVLCNTGEDPELEKKEIDSLLDRQVDGLIIASCCAERDTRHLKTMRIPYTLIDRKFRTLRCACVVCDDEKVGFMATEHLIRVGHRRIGHLAGPNVSTAKLRYQGYKKALKQYQIPFRRKLVWPCGFDNRDGYQVAQTLLEKKDSLDAIFAVNDPVAFGVLQRFDEQGVDVPAEVALVGAGDLDYCSILKVPLTTVHFPQTDIGAAAARLLWDNLEGARHFRQVTLEPKLVVRASCGAQLRKKKAAK